MAVSKRGDVAVVFVLALLLPPFTFAAPVRFKDDKALTAQKAACETQKKEKQAEKEDFYVRMKPTVSCGRKSLVALGLPASNEMNCAILNANAGGAALKDNWESGDISKFGSFDRAETNSRRTISVNMSGKMVWNNAEEDFVLKPTTTPVCFNANMHREWGFSGQIARVINQEATIPDDEFEPYIWRLHARNDAKYYGTGYFFETMADRFMRCSNSGSPSGCLYHGQILTPVKTGGKFKTCFWKTSAPIFDTPKPISSFEVDDALKQCTFFEDLPADEVASIEAEINKTPSIKAGFEKAKAASQGSVLGNSLACFPQHVQVRFDQKMPVGNYEDGLCKNQFDEDYGRCFDAVQCYLQKTDFCKPKEGFENPGFAAATAYLCKNKNTKGCNCAVARINSAVAAKKPGSFFPVELSC